MKKFDYLSKELVKTLSFTTTTQNRESFSEVNIDGRRYIKTGTLQAITFIGLVYEDAFGKKIMHVGISKQHPNDSKCDKQIAYENAYLKCLNNPDIIFNTIPEYIDMFNFRKMMQWYYDGMNLEYIRTKEEIQSSNKNTKEYNR